MLAFSSSWPVQEFARFQEIPHHRHGLQLAPISQEHLMDSADRLMQCLRELLFVLLACQQDWWLILHVVGTFDHYAEWWSVGCQWKGYLSEENLRKYESWDAHIRLLGLPGHASCIGTGSVRCLMLPCKALLLSTIESGMEGLW
jgi:hypothetical protein